MAKTMEQYMSKTRADYGSGIARPKIKDKYNFELKGQFLKELRTNTFSGSDHEDANEHIEKVLEIVDLFHIPNITIDQVMLRAFPMSLTGAASRWLRNEPTGSITTWDGLKTKFLNKYCPPARTAKKMEEINNFQQEPDENLYQAWERFKELLMKCPQHYLTEMQEVILFYNGLGIPTRQILDSRGAIPSKTAADAKVAIQEMAEYSQKWHNGTSRSRSTKTSDGLAAIQAQLNNLGREIKKVNEKVYAAQEIRASTDAAIRNQRASIKTLEIQIGQISKVLQERGFGSLPSSIEANLRDQVKSISTTIEADSYPIRCIGSSQYVVSTGHNRTLMYETKQRTIPFLSHLNGASVSIMPLSTYLNLGLGELAHTKLTVELADKTVKYPKGIIENLLVDIGKFVFLIDFIILDILEDIKVPLILGRPFLSTSRAKIDVLRERMELDLEARLIRETLVINRSLDPLNRDYIELNDLNKPFELRINQGDDLMPTIEEGEVTEEFKTRDDELDTGISDYPSCCDYNKKIHKDYAHNLKLSCMIGFEFMHANLFLLLYVIVMSKKFHNSIMKDKMVYKGNNIVGALMNIPIFVGTFSILTDFAVLEDMDAYRDKRMGDVSEEDKKNGISHPYQKLKRFYKGVLNLGPDYIRDAKTEEWLTRGHISVHEMEW
ncbi:reverse transcriptase domain-containing protein [Tanacetum coccineum]